jgi:hypothetical protein
LQLIAVTGRVAPTPRQAIPLQGSDTGGAADFLEVKLEVKLTAGEQR